MDELVEWLRAQLDDDERVANAAAPGPWRLLKREPGEPGMEALEIEAEGGDGIVDNEGGAIPPGYADAEHIARHDPARVLREVEAKRRILAVIQRWTHYSCQDGWYSCSQATEENGFPADEQCADDDRAGEPCDCGLDWRRMVILAPLALPYADRPGYREEWRP